MYPHAQCGCHRPLRAREGRHQSRGDVADQALSPPKSPPKSPSESRSSSRSTNCEALSSSNSEAERESPRVSPPMSFRPASRARSLPAALLLPQGEPDGDGSAANARDPWFPNIELMELRSNAPPITPAADAAAVPRKEPPNDGAVWAGAGCARVPPVFQRGSGPADVPGRTLGTDVPPARPGST